MDDPRSLHVESVTSRIASTAAMLEQAVREAGIVCSVDGRIGSADMARLLNLSPATMRNMRTQDRGPIPYHFPVGASRVSYKILDIAAWIEITRHE